MNSDNSSVDSAIIDMASTRLGFVGSFLGSHQGFPPDHAELLAERLSQDGYQAFQTSSSKNRLFRLLDIILSLYSWRHQVQLVMINVYSGRAFILADAASLTAKILGFSIIFMLHGGNLPDFFKRYPAWVKRVLKRGDRFVAPSVYLADAFRALHKVTVISNMIDLEAYPFHLRSQVRPNLFWMRTFEDIYNPELAIETLSILKRDFPEAQLTMAGRDQGLLEATRVMVRDRGVENNVRFVGFLDLDGKKRELTSHDIFLNTNRVDNMPVSLLEVAACGLPIVSTNVGGIPFLFVNEKSAMLVPNNDADAMAQAVIRLLCEPELACRLSQNGRKIALASGWNSIKSQWDSLIADILDTRRKFTK